MFIKMCDQLLDMCNQDESLSEEKKKILSLKIHDLKLEFVNDDVNSSELELNFVEEFEARYPNVTFCIDCVSRTMSRLGM